MKSLARTSLTGLAAALLLLGPALQDSNAQGRGGGGFSRGGVAASGAFSARGGGMAGDSFRASAPNLAATRPEVSRPAQPPSAEQRPPGDRSPPTSQRLPGGYPPPGSQQPPQGHTPPPPPPQYQYHDHDTDWDDDWDHSDAAVGFVVGAATGALVNEALQPEVVVTELTTPTSAPAPAAVTRLPCSPASSLVGGVTYYRCGSTYYVQAYTQGGLLYVPVAPP